MNIAAYLRVSTNEQSADNQLPAILDYCKAHWWPEPVIYSETESAWRNGHQAELSRLLNEVRTGKRKYDYLVIWSIDRLSRGGVGELFTLIHAFKKAGCQVVSIQESWLDNAGPAGDLLLAVTGWVAEFESKRRSERTLAGLDRARANGKKLGRPAGSKDNGKRRKSGYVNRWMVKK